jgi:hypothetical protein
MSPFLTPNHVCNWVRKATNFWLNIYIIFNVMNTTDVLPYVDVALCTFSKYMKTAKRIIETFQPPSATYLGYILSYEQCYGYVRGRVIAEAVSRWLPTAAAQVWAKVRLCGICGGQNRTGGRFSPSTSVSPPNTHSNDCSTRNKIWGCRGDGCGEKVFWSVTLCSSEGTKRFRGT